MHFPLSVDEEYFSQLCAEHRETRTNRAGVVTHTVWVQDRERNEALDTAVLCLAAFRLMDGPRRVRQMADRLLLPAPKPGEAPRRPVPAPSRPIPGTDAGGIDVPDDWLEGRR
jgi:phage terminase large subunit GpA-like protein